MVVMGEKDMCLFFIVNVVFDNSCIELYIGVEFGNSYVGEVLECMCVDGEIIVNVGNGNVFL